MKRNITSPSIPSKQQSKRLQLQSQNIGKIKDYQNDHFLEQVDQPKRLDKFSEQIPPFPCQFKQKQFKEIITLPEFLEKENPPPFNGIQAIPKEQNENKLEIQQFLRIQHIKCNNENEKYSSIHNSSFSDQNHTIKELYEEINKEHEQYFENFIKKLEEEKIVEKKVNDFVKLPLPELLKLPQHFTKQNKDQYRSLSTKEKQIVQQDHQQQQQIIKEKMPKMTLQQLEIMMENTKKDYFKIVRDLDMLNKGARQLKNVTQQQFGIRKQVDEPNINKLIKNVKDTIWYSEGITNGFDREINLIQHLNKQNNNQIDIDKLLQQNDNQIQIKEKSQNNNSNISQSLEIQPKIQEKQNETRAQSFLSKSNQTIINSKKGKEIQEYLNEELF